MKAAETLEEFNQQHGHADTDPVRQREAARTGQFNVFDVETFCVKDLTYTRRDFYKISLLMEAGQLNYADRSVVIDRPALIFSNPLIPYSWEGSLKTQRGYFCLFTEDFLIINDRSAKLQESPLFKLGSDPVFFPDETQIGTLSYLFRQLLTERDSTYIHKHDLLRSYVNLIIHEALKMRPQTTYHQYPNAASRIVSLFTELLERQFPIESPDRSLKLRTANDFATYLSVHVNHLNRAVRDLTGKTTTLHIAERMISEAKALLQHTNWSIAEIAYSLGFEYTTYFNNFFKKHTGSTPKSLRSERPSPPDNTRLSLS